LSRNELLRAPVKAYETPENGPIELVVGLNQPSVKVEVIATGVYDFPAFDKRFQERRTEQFSALRRSKSMPNGAFGLNEIVSFDRRTDQRTTLNISNAQALPDGPIAHAELPRGLPLGLPGVFVAI
jgi:carotenoid cleavage dioxygenase-like enzyme